MGRRPRVSGFRADALRRHAHPSAKLAEAERKTEQYGLTGTPTVVIEGSMKMDIGRYGSIEKFVTDVPQTFADLLAKP